MDTLLAGYGRRVEVRLDGRRERGVKASATPVPARPSKAPAYGPCGAERGGPKTPGGLARALRLRQSKAIHRPTAPVASPLSSAKRRSASDSLASPATLMKSLRPGRSFFAAS